MPRSRLTATAATLLALVAAQATAAPPATAQTLVPNPACLFGGCDEDDRDGPDEDGAEDPGCSGIATLVCAGSSIVSGVTGAAGDAVTAGLDVVGDSAMSGLTSWVAGGASWLVDRVGEMLQRSTRPAIGSAWFTRQYSAMIGVAVALALVVFLCAVINATVRQDVAMLLRTAFVALPLALCLCFAGVTLVEIALGVTDWMTAEVLSNFDSDTDRFFKDIGGSLAPAALTQRALPGFLVFLSGLFLAMTTLLVWLELVMREAAIYVAVAFLPLSFAAMIWQRTAHWCRRLVDVLVALILAKFTIASSIALAASAMAHARDAGGLTALLAGTAVMLVAAFTPLLLLRMIPFAETAAQTGMQRAAIRGAVSSAPGVNTASMVVRLAMVQQFGSVLSAARSGGAGGRAALPPAPTGTPVLPAGAPAAAKPAPAKPDERAGGQ